MRSSQFTFLSFLATFFLVSGVYAKPPIEVIAYQATIESKPQIIKSLGLLQAKQSIDISTNASDSIKAIFFNSGQMVNKGDLLLTLNDTEEQASLQEAMALEKETLAQYQRVKKAVSRNTVTQSLVDEKYREWRTAIAQRKVMEAMIADRKITAPFSGQLGFSSYAVGAKIAAGTPVVSLDNISEMKLDMAIPNRFLSYLKIGQTVTLNSSAYPKKTFTGKISALSPRLQADTRLLQVQALIPNPNGLLKTNMMVEAQIQLPNKNQLTIPNTALLMLGDKEFLYRLVADKDNLYKAEKILVKSGEIGSKNSEILSGLNSGDLVVSQGVMKVNTKASIKVKGLQNELSQEKLLQPSQASQPVKTKSP